MCTYVPARVCAPRCPAALKVWDLDTQHCVQTCVGHRSEVWGMDVSPDETRVVTGAADGQIRVWRVSGEGSGAGATARAGGADVGKGGGKGSVAGADEAAGAIVV